MDEQQELQHWQIEIDDDKVVWLTLDHADSPVNVLSSSVMEELDTSLTEIAQLSPAALVIQSGKKSGFIAGADVSEFSTLCDGDRAFKYIRKSQETLNRLESFHFPTICLISGFCMGGGLELALACRYRVAEDISSTRLGLPEVRLGIHPGFGGSVRLPPLIGTIAAMDMMLTGRSVSASAARKLGLVNYAVPERHLINAVQKLIQTKPKQKKASQLKTLPSHKYLRPLLAKYLRKKVAIRAPEHHYPSPYALIDLWLHYADKPEAMMEEEARSLARMLVRESAQNLIRVFFLQSTLKSLGKDADFKARNVHVIGAGTMGGDIAAWCALRGMNVSLQDRTPESLSPAMQRAYKLFKKKLKKPRLVQAALDRLMPDIDGLGIKNADVVIEAIFEDLEVKRALYKTIEPQMKPDALLATNTSSIPLEELAEVLKDPSRLVGLHFFNPVAKMQLVEVVKGKDTDDEAVRKAAAFTGKISRLPLLVKSTPGFLVNRILMPYLMEAVIMVGEGIEPVTIDQAALNFGMPMGPIELADTVGLDICLSVAEILSSHLGGTVPEILKDRVSTGNLGKKSGRGFFEYKKGKVVKPKQDKNQRIPEDIQDRLIFRLLNECVACLNEGVVENMDQLDAGIIFGTGFAPFRGGPMHFNNARGLSDQIKRLEFLEQTYGERFKKNEGWDQLFAK